MNTIKLYGERNTNTNYLSQLIILNLNATELPGVVPPIIKRLQNKLPGNEWVKDLFFKLTFSKNLGWKHQCILNANDYKTNKIINEKNVRFITITKNPYSWLLSLYRNPYHQYYEAKPSFESFLNRPWKTIQRDQLPSQNLNPIELWNLKNKSYFALPEENSLHLTTEEIFVDAESVIERISKKLNIPKLQNHFVEFVRSTKDPTKDGNYYRDYYLNEKWRSELSDEAIQIINKFLDKDVMAKFKYKII